MKQCVTNACRVLVICLGLAVPAAWAGDMPAASSSSASPADASMLSRAEVTKIIADSRKIVSPNGIQELVKVPINGIDQWLSIRGRNRRNPILLYLHGGPGAPTMPEAWTFQSPWEDYFTVVQWDQRGTGKTYASNTEAQMAPGMTIDGMTADAAQVVRYLRQRFGKRKIFLLGHSWGTVLGVRLAQRHPDWFYAYIGVGQVVNTRKNEQAGYAFALRQAKADGNAAAVRELQAIAPYPGSKPLTIDRIGVRSKWETHYGGLVWGRTNFSSIADTWQLSPEYSEADLDAIDKGSRFSLKHLLQPMLAIDFDDVTTFDCPVLLFVGAHDYTTPHKLVEQWFDAIHAPSKHLVIFADSAHMIMQEQPGRFLVHLVTDALPYAREAGDVAPAEVTR